MLNSHLTFQLTHKFRVFIRNNQSLKFNLTCESRRNWNIFCHSTSLNEFYKSFTRIIYHENVTRGLLNDKISYS